MIDVPITRRIALELLAENTTPSEAALIERIGHRNAEKVHRLLERMIEVGLIARSPVAQHCPDGSLESLFPALMTALAGGGCGLLADESGLPIGTHGFEPDAAIQLAALSATMLEVVARQHTRLRELLGFRTQSCGLIDSQGSSQFGFWPIQLGGQRMVLTLKGRPHLGSSAFVTLIWLLVRRYGGCPL